jgi:hypothetical protein
VRGESRGRFVVYRADYGTMNELLAYLTANCCLAFDRAAVDDAVVWVPVDGPAKRAPPSARLAARSRRAR